MDMPDINIGDDEAFAARMQLGNFLGQIKDWSVVMGQLPQQLADRINNWDEVEEQASPEAFRSTMITIFDFVMSGMTALIGTIQDHATILYGEPFPMSSFALGDIKIGVGAIDLNNLESSIAELPAEVRDQAIKAVRDALESDNIPDDVKAKIIKFLEEN